MFVVLLAANVVLTVRYGLWWYSPGHVPRNPLGGPEWVGLLVDYGAFIALSLLESLRILQMAVLWVFATVMRSARRMPVPNGLRVAVLTTIVPSSEPISILEQTIPAMLAIRSEDPFDVWILDEGDDPGVKALCERLGVHHFSRRGIERYNQPSGPFKARTKAGNHNAWRDRHAAAYDVVAQMDPDHIPEPNFLEATLGYFADPDVAFVIAPQVYYRNTSTSWIARGADEANFGFSAVTQRGANRLRMPIFIGSNHLARSAALDSVGGYASHIVEDHLTGMRLLTTPNPVTGHKWKGVYTEEIISLGEGPARWSAWLSQQLRWAYGLVSIVQSQTPRLIRRMSPQQILGFLLIESYYPSVAGILVLGGILTVAHLLFGINAINVRFDDWLSHFLPQLSMSIAMWYWLQRFYIRDTDRGWALRSILANLGAMVIYAEAVVLAVLRRPLVYVVTPKGEVGVREPFRLFRWHIAILVVSVGVLSFAFATHTGEWIMRFWALLMFVQMLAVIVTGSVFPWLLRTSLSWKVSDFFNRYTVRVAVPVVIAAFGLAVAPILPVFREPPREDEVRTLAASVLFLPQSQTTPLQLVLRLITFTYSAR